MARFGSRLGSLRLEHLWPATVLTLIFALTAAMPVAQADFWWHVTVGEQIAATRSIPALDTFTHTQAGDPYPSYQQFWLMDLVLYWLHALGGPVLVSVVHALTLTTTYALVLWVAWRASHSWRAAAIATLLAAILGFFNWNIRPQTAAFLLGALLLAGITAQRSSASGRWVALFPLVMVVWANAHGTFPIGLALLGLWVLDELVTQARAIRAGEAGPATGLTRAALALLLSLLATFVSPAGPGWLRYVGAMAGNEAVQGVSEWLPPDPTEAQGASFFAVLLLMMFVLIRSPRRPTLVELVTFLAFAALGIRYGRGSVWLGIVAAPVIAAHLAALGARFRPAQPAAPSRTESRFALGGLVVLTLAALVAAAPAREALTGRQVIASDTPVESTAFLLAAQPPGPIFNSQVFGSYLIWAAQPDYPVFIDSRVELFPDAVWEDYAAISAARWDWQARLDRYGVRTLFLSPEYAEHLIEAATASPAWVEIYRDDVAVILTQSP